MQDWRLTWLSYVLAAGINGDLTAVPTAARSRDGSTGAAGERSQRQGMAHWQGYGDSGPANSFLGHAWLWLLPIAALGGQEPPEK